MKTLKQFLKETPTNGVGNGGYTSTGGQTVACLLYTSPSPRDQRGSRMPSSA